MKIKNSYKQLANGCLTLGFSLVELLIGMAILAFVSLIVAYIYNTHFKLFNNQSVNIDVASQNRLALDEMVYQIREANLVSGTQFVIGCGGSQTSGSSTIVIRLWPLDPITGDPFDPGSTAPDSAYDFVRYCADANNNLHKIVQKQTTGTSSKRTNSDKILATGVSILEFTFDPPVDSTQVIIRLKIEAKNYDQRQIFSTDQTAKSVLRNK